MVRQLRNLDLRRLVRGATFVLIALGAVSRGLVSTAQVCIACDTPVYRYATYNWAPSDFHLFLLREGAASPEDHALMTAADASRQVGSSTFNLAHHVIDTAKENWSAQVPPTVAQAWDSRRDGDTSLHVVIAPNWQVLFAGQLDESAMAAISDSPVRAEIARLLSEESGVVMLLLEGDKSVENDVVAEIIERVKGHVPAPNPEAIVEGAPLLPETVEPDPTALSMTISFLRVARDDPQEAWLINTLLAIESDLKEITEPMVFAIYGRGRSMEPYIGPGINEGNLQDVTTFLSGACSCEVKEQNPGMDLLMTCDWDAAAVAMAERAGPETGNERLVGFDDLFPTIIVGGSDPLELPDVDTALAAVGEDADNSDEEDLVTSVAASSDLPGNGDESDVTQAVASVVPSLPPLDASEDVADAGGMPDSASNPAPPSDGSLLGSKMLGTLGIGMGAVLVVLAVTSLILFRARPEN